VQYGNSQTVCVFNIIFDVRFNYRKPRRIIAREYFCSNIFLQISRFKISVIIFKAIVAYDISSVFERVEFKRDILFASYDLLRCKSYLCDLSVIHGNAELSCRLICN